MNQMVESLSVVLMIERSRLVSPLGSDGSEGPVRNVTETQLIMTFYLIKHGIWTIT